MVQNGVNDQHVRELQCERRIGYGRAEVFVVLLVAVLARQPSVEPSIGRCFFAVHTLQAGVVV